MSGPTHEHPPQESPPAPLSQERFEEFFDLSRDLLCVASVEGYFKHVNSSFTEALGYSRHELLSCAFVDLIHPEDVLSTQQELVSLRAGNPTRNFENRYRHKDGSYVHLSWTAVPRPDGLVYAIARDITSHKEAVRSLKETNEHLDRFAHVASHDLRAPLRAIQQLSSLLAEELAPQLSKRHHELLNAINDNTQRMTSLLEGLLRFSRAGHPASLVEELDLETLFAQTSQLARTSYPTRTLHLHIDALPVLQSPREPLEHIVRNLLDNAIKHHDREIVHIKVFAEHQVGSVVLHVEDDGPGIPARHHERIFQLFQTLRPQTDTETSGLGLALAQRTARRYGGSLTVTSPLDKDRGARFSLTWPEPPK